MAITKVVRYCAVCETELVPKQGRSKFCIRACERENEKRVRKEKRLDTPGAIVLGHPFSCFTCGRETIATGPKSKYCEDCRYESRLASYRKYNNRDIAKQRARERLKFDPKYALDRRISWSIWDSIKNAKANRNWEDIVGYSIDDLSAHIEKQFLPRMTWENMGRWHIDHIRPKSSFTYTSEDDAEFRDCWSLTNLRPLWAKDNVKKSNSADFLV